MWPEGVVEDLGAGDGLVCDVYAGCVGGRGCGLAGGVEGWGAGFGATAGSGGAAALWRRGVSHCCVCVCMVYGMDVVVVM